MEILKMIVALLTLALILSSCTPTDERALDYQNYPFSALISFELDGQTATARLSVSPVGESDKNIKLEFTSPDSLSGLIIERSFGKTYAHLGDLVFFGSTCESYLNLAELFCIEGKISEIQAEKIGTTDTTRLTIITDSSDIYRVYLTQNGEPRRIISEKSGKRFVLDILAFECAK